VLGAGVSGLAAAYFIRRRLGSGHPLTVLEASDEVGGKVRTVGLAGLAVDTGPDAFLARAEDLRGLIQDLGLASQVVEPRSSGAYVWSRGRLRTLPPGSAFGLPDRLWPFLRSGLLSPLGVARAGLDLVRPSVQPAEDPSIRDLVHPRFGTEVYERLVEPLLGGVHAGDPAVLSARSAVPEIAALAGQGRSLYRTMRRRRPPPAPASGRRPAALVSLYGGMGGLIDALVDQVGPDAVTTGVSVRSVTRGAGQSLVVDTAAGAIDANDVIVATPAWAAADILEASSPIVAGLLREIPYVDVANVTLAFHRTDVPVLPPGTGFLVPPVERELIVGCSWLTSKWPHLAQDDVVLIKAMVGRYGDDRWVRMADDELVSRVLDGLHRMMGVDANPVDVLVQRWPRSMPQYVVGHADRLAAVDAELDQLGQVHLTGAAYRGVGLAGCVAQASATVERIAEGVRT
jgi:protoporphyrinogen/coproporphyrinogen III oxidase